MFRSFPEPEVPEELGLTNAEDQIVYKAVTDLTTRVKTLTRDFVRRVGDLSKKNGIPVNYMWHVIYAERKLWPDMKKEYKQALSWAASMAAVARTAPSTQGWESSAPGGDSEVTVDLLLLEFGTWAFGTMLYRQTHKELKDVLDRYKGRYKKILQQKYPGEKFSDDDAIGALLVECVRQVHKKGWRFDEARLVSALFRLMGYTKTASDKQDH